jgi:hypothetical protein
MIGNWSEMIGGEDEMRPLELSLVLANLLTLVVLAVPQLHAVRWTGMWRSSRC